MRYKELIDDPSFPHWGRAIILDTLREGRDPVDTANVLEVLAAASIDELKALQETNKRIMAAAHVGEWLDESIEAFDAAQS